MHGILKLDEVMWIYENTKCIDKLNTNYINIIYSIPYVHTYIHLPTCGFE